jgi:mannose-6-phosphate isomerase-like protein (cupin superfamily)
MTELPTVVSLKAESELVVEKTIADVDDHVVRIYVWTEPYHWHQHPDSDEAFLVVEGSLDIEFDDGTVRIHQGNC